MTVQPPDADPNRPPTFDGVLLSRDLMFVSKVTGTAAALGMQIEAIGSIDGFRMRLKSGVPRAVFLDLNCPDFEPHVVIAELPGYQRPKVVAFGSHVDTARLDLAQRAGCDEVLPRSRFSSQLPELLRLTCQVSTER